MKHRTESENSSIFKTSIDLPIKFEKYPEYACLSSQNSDTFYKYNIIINKNVLNLKKKGN